MAFGDGLMLLGIELTPTQIEASAADIKDYVIPVHCQVEQFGVYITEDFIVEATDPVVKLQKKTTLGGSAADLIALTLGSSVTTWKKGDGVKAMQTAITADTDIDNGHVMYAGVSKDKQQFKPGDILTFRHATAATGAGGAYVPWVLLRVADVECTQTNTWKDSA